MIETTTYGNRKTILIGQDSFHIALPAKVSGSANATLKAGQPLAGTIASRLTQEFTASTTAATCVLLHDVKLDANGKGNGTIVIAGCIDKLKLESDMVTALATAKAADGSSLDNIIVTEGSAI